MTPSPHGLYLVSDSYFARFPSKYWMWNKGENRPHYFALQDKCGLYWMIPLSSNASGYTAKIQKEEQKRGDGNCLFYHIGRVYGKPNAFIISGAFPVTEQYILRPYTFGNLPYIIQDQKLITALRSKLNRYIRLLEQRQLRDNNRILQIRDELLKQI